jgi:hypothetical protein
LAAVARFRMLSADGITSEAAGDEDLERDSTFATTTHPLLEPMARIQGSVE